jgi:hypothetical protein
MKKLTWFVFFSIIAFSCLNEPDCYQLDNDEIIVAFNVMGFGSDVDTLVDVRISGTDSIFYPATVTSSLLLPLKPIVRELEYVFRWIDGSRTRFCSAIRPRSNLYRMNAPNATFLPD